VPVILRGVWMN